MGDSIEYMIKKKPSVVMQFLKVLCIMLTVAFFLCSLYTVVGLILAILFGVLAYFAKMNGELEYEYLYVEKTLDIDKIMAQSKRKHVATYELERIEILAPLNSYHLDNYKNRTVKVLDYSSGVEEKPEKRYCFFYEGNEKIIFEPNEEMIRAFKNAAPRKVFTD